MEYTGEKEYIDRSELPRVSVFRRLGWELALVVLLLLRLVIHALLLVTLPLAISVMLTWVIAGLMGLFLLGLWLEFEMKIYGWFLLVVSAIAIAGVIWKNRGTFVDGWEEFVYELRVSRRLLGNRFRRINRWLPPELQRSGPFAYVAVDDEPIWPRGSDPEDERHRLRWIR